MSFQQFFGAFFAEVSFEDLDHNVVDLKLPEGLGEILCLVGPSRFTGSNAPMHQLRIWNSRKQHDVH